MLGVLQVMAFQESNPNEFRKYYQHSLDPAHEFPFMIKLFEFTTIVLTQMKSDKLYNLCNRQGNVFEATNFVYSKLVIKYLEEYIADNCTIMQMDALSKKQKRMILEQGIIKYVGNDASAVRRPAAAAPNNEAASSEAATNQ
jgi:hypothetical protein